MKKMTSLFLIAAILLVPMGSYATETQFDFQQLYSSAISWLNSDFDIVSQNIIDLGYKIDNSILILNGQLYTKQDGIPKSIMIHSTDGTSKVQLVNMIFTADSTLFSTIYQYCVNSIGDAEIKVDSALWETEKVFLGLSCSFLEENYNKATLFELQVGKYDFIFSINDRYAFQEEADVNHGDKASNSTSTHKPTPRPTVKPTANPLIKKISISSLRIGKNSIGTPELFVVFQNNTSYTIDRIDFNVICYDAYGRIIKGYNFYDSTSCYYDDSNINPGGKTPSNHRWTLNGFDGTKSVDIAITEFHTTSGKTVTIPEALWVYTRYK